MKQELFESWIKNVHEKSKKILPFMKRPHTLNERGSATGVRAGRQSVSSLLQVNKDDLLATAMNEAGFSLEESWLLTLAHESGHIELNARCIQLRIDPSDPNMQLQAMGLPDVKNKADYHKESAIESFCDAILVNHAIDMLGSRWEIAVRALLKLRDEEASKVKIFSGDGYATQPILKLALETKTKLDPQNAAQIALDLSLKNESTLRQVMPLSNEIFAAAASVAEHFDKLNKSVLQLKSKILNRRKTKKEEEEEEASEVLREPRTETDAALSNGKSIDGLHSAKKGKELR